MTRKQASTSACRPLLRPPPADRVLDRSAWRCPALRRPSLQAKSAFGLGNRLIAAVITSIAA
jgi:hypothetical protein